MINFYSRKKERKIRKNGVQANAVKRLSTYVKPYKWFVVLICLLVLGVTCFELYRPILVGDAIDRCIDAGNLVELKKTSLIYLLVLLGSFLCNFLQMWILELVGQSIIYNIREEVYEHLHKLSVRFFDITPVGRIITRVTNNVETLNEMFANILAKLFKNIVKIIGIGFVMLSLNLKLALYGFILIPFIVILTLIFKKISMDTYRLVRKTFIEVNTFLSEHISGMKIIQIFARENEKFEEFKTKNKNLFSAYYKEMMVFAVFRPTMYILSVVDLIIILWLGGEAVLKGSISIGTLFIFIQYINSFFEPIQELTEQLGTIQSALSSAEKIFEFLDEESLEVNPAIPQKIENVKGRIEFEHVWFAYEEENWILKDVSFVIEGGTRAAFVGATGAGKSSILNLIGRYYEIQKGKITVDGIDIKGIPVEQLRKMIGQVQQEVFVFSGNISDNISLGNDNITKEDVKKAAQYVNASDFIERLNHGYEEVVLERGASLSAGERQLLSFARTLAYDPAILVMDEATSNIDTKTEELIQDALDKLMTGRTTLIVAHRLSTIQHVDKIVVMHKGELYEMGTHQELLSYNGIYKKLYDLQVSRKNSR